ncbi:YfiR family protein [Oceanicoccus sp. KOV_DT_Chl]|uniref:YfiR family protein n=1 Tax=Oceanicoccus sp. KOV_DT_Chl TaxID=1904639 RepID=UPI000C7B7B9F|nr:YfiR family protein [Oceanicoccus sp. KOV_DT_Chl]
MRSLRPRLRRSHLMIQVFCLVVSPLVFAAGDVAQEEARLKSAYLFNFGKFIQWPEGEATNLRYCILGAPKVYNYLKEADGRKLNNKTLEVVELTSKATVSSCNLVYASPELLQTLPSWQYSNTVLVTDKTNNRQSPAVIEFVVINDKLQFTVNLSLARQLEITISATLLKLAIQDQSETQK